jgi:ribosomal protein S20
MANTILDSYGSLLVNPSKPELGTIYNRYAEEIEKTRSIIKGSAKETVAEENAVIKDEIKTIVNTFRSASETGNLTQSQQAFDAAEQELGKLTEKYPEATEALSRIRQIGRNYNSLTEENVVQAVARGSIKSRTELQLLAANGYISADTANKLAEQLPEDDSSEMVKELRPRMESFIRNQLRATFKFQGADFDSFKDQTNSLVGALTDELMEAGLGRMLELKAAGKTTGKAQIQSFLEKQALDALKTERFKPTKDSKGNVILPTPGVGLPSVVPYSTGPNGRDYSRQIINRLPPVVSAKRDVLLDADKVQANIDALNNGGQPSADLVTVAKASGLSVREVLSQQAQKNGLTYTVGSADTAAKKFQENSKLDPSAAQILANPRSTAAQRIRATARLAEAKRRQQQASAGPSGGRTLGAGDYGGLAALISSGEGGFNSVNRGTAGDTPSGMNLTSMRIGDVQKLQAKFNATNGREGVFAVGFAQWVSDGQLDMAVITFNKPPLRRQLHQHKDG